MSLGGFLLLFVASHLLYLVLIDPRYLLSYPVEELYRGTIAQELATGLKIPFTEYRADTYSGGSLVIGTLASGFFLLFGPTLFALKLAPLCLFTLALAFWYWTIEREAGKREARHFALLFCFSPPLVTAYSVTALGAHSESIVFSALTVLLLFKMLSEEKPSLAYPVLLGLTAGFGLWFTYIYGLTLLAMLGCWLWHDKGRFWQPRVPWFALGFVVGFAPWIVLTAQNHFAALMIHGINMWKHFEIPYLWDAFVYPQRLAPVEFFTRIGSDYDWDLYRRTVNLLYSLLYLGPILTVGVFRLKTVRSDPAGPRPPHLMLVRFSILYLILFTLAVQFSDFRNAKYYQPAYPFLFFLVAHSLARCQDLLPRVQRQIQAVFLASVVVLGLGTHAPLLSLDRPGAALSAKGYAYAELERIYLHTHTPAGMDDRNLPLELVQRPLLFDILPRLSADDQRDLSRAIALRLALAAPLNGEAEDFSRFEGLVPPGFDRYFYYQVGVTAMGRPLYGLPQAVAAVEFIRRRSAAAHHLALVGIYRSWPLVAALNSSPESLANSPPPVASELSAHYWRALGYLAARYWYEYDTDQYWRALGLLAFRYWFWYRYDTDQSLSRLNAHLQSFVPRLDPSVQRSFLQGIGELLFTHLSMTPWVPPVELERFPHAYQEGLLEGWGIALSERELFSPLPWKGHESLLWRAATKGLSARSRASIQRGKAQFEALFEGPTPSAVEPPLNQ